MVNNYPRGKYNKKKRYAKRTTEVKRKIAAYKKNNKRPARNAMRPFVETKFREVDRGQSHHLIYNNTTGQCTVSATPQMSINALNLGTGTNFAVPQDFTCIVPAAWSEVWTQGASRAQINGRCIYPTYLNLKVEMDWSARSTSPQAETGVDDNWFCIKGWAKNSLIKQVQDEKSLPTSSAAVATAMGQIVGKCCQQSGINGDPLAFPSKKKDIVIQSHFRVKGNLSERYVDAVTSTGGVDGPTTFTLPKVMNFSWTVKRKQLLRTAGDALTGQFVLADSWVPFVGFFNRSISATPHTHTPDLFHSSKIYFTDQ